MLCLMKTKKCSVCYSVTAIFKKHMKYARLKIRPRKVMSGKLNKKEVINDSTNISSANVMC